jgi:ABC-2 type transport system permease protein
VEEVSIFNPSGGYGSSVLPAVLFLIIQQTLALGVGMAAGTARERSRYSDIVPVDKCYSSVGRILSGKTLCYLMIYAVMCTYLAIVVPRMFNFIHIATWQSLLALLIPYLLSCVLFAQTVSCLVHYRENVILLMVFMSVPLLFMSGVSWPQSSIPSFWQVVSWIFPSTFGIRAFVRLNSMGATLSDVSNELLCLWGLVIFYFAMACIVYGVEMGLAKQHTTERLEVLRKKRAIRLLMKEKKKGSE